MSRAEIVDDELVPVEENPVLQGNFAPVDEELVVQDLPVEGAIPAQLNGSLFRDGPTPIAPGPGHHWVLGDGRVHSITIRDGTAQSYRNRWIRTKQVEELKGFPAGFISPNQPMQQGSGSVNVIRHGGHMARPHWDCRIYRCVPPANAVGPDPLQNFQGGEGECL